MEQPLRLGHDLIDQQHAELFHCISNLHSLRERLCDNRKIQQFLSTLAGMLTTHFMTEEQMMLEVNVPEGIYLAHKADHQQILASLICLHESGLNGTRYDLSDVCQKAQVWVNDHVAAFDEPLIPYCQAPS